MQQSWLTAFGPGRYLDRSRRRTATPLALASIDAKTIERQPSDEDLLPVLSDCVSAKEIMREHTPQDIVLDLKKLTKFLESHRGIRWRRPPDKKGNPIPNRLVIHVGDWAMRGPLREWYTAHRNPIENVSDTEIAERLAAVQRIKNKAGNEHLTSCSLPWLLHVDAMAAGDCHGETFFHFQFTRKKRRLAKTSLARFALRDAANLTAEKCYVCFFTPAESTPAKSGALLDVQAVAELLGCSTRHVYRLSDAGLSPHPVKLGSLARWRAPRTRNLDRRRVQSCSSRLGERRGVAMTSNDETFRLTNEGDRRRDRGMKQASIRQERRNRRHENRAARSRIASVA